MLPTGWNRHEMPVNQQFSFEAPPKSILKFIDIIQWVATPDMRAKGGMQRNFPDLTWALT